MTREVNSVLMCLIVGFSSHSQGLQFTLDWPPDTVYCGHLNCSVDVNQNDARILSVVGLTISSIVHSNTLIKLASVSVFDPVPQLESSKVHDLNVTGSVSRYHGNLNISLYNKTDCLMASFLCELDFVNVSGQSDMIRKVVTPKEAINCPEIANQIAIMSEQLQTHTDDVDRKLTDLDIKLTDVDGKLTDLKSQNTATEQELAKLKDLNVAMETKLDSVLGYLSRLEVMLNSSLQTVGSFSCVRGAPHDDPREKFLLWGRVPALCDTEIDGGGWVIIQRRTQGDTDFYRGWSDYKKGFGTPYTDYWLGNDNIHNLTSHGYTNLRVDMKYQGMTYVAEYSNFSVADELSYYKLTFGGYHGNSGDALSYHSGMAFSTFDRDNDQYTGNCAADHHGAWWYNNCHKTNLNGRWGAQDYSGLCWEGVVFPGSVTSSEMKIRQV